MRIMARSLPIICMATSHTSSASTRRHRRSAPTGKSVAQRRPSADRAGPVRAVVALARRRAKHPACPGPSPMRRHPNPDRVFQDKSSHAEMDLADHPQVIEFVRTGDSPITFVTWVEAAAYGNWLSEQGGIPADQWCYAPNPEGKFAAGMRPKANTDTVMNCCQNTPGICRWLISSWQEHVDPSRGHWSFRC